MRTFIQSRTGLVLIAFLAIAGFFLVTEHTAHLLGLWPFAFLFLCMGMHLFMHGGHGGHGGHSEGGGHGDTGTDAGHSRERGREADQGYQGYQEPSGHITGANKLDKTQGGGVS